MATTKLMTAEDLWQLDDSEHRYDLIRGELIQMSPAGAEHGELAMTIGGFLWSHARKHRLGKTYGAETGFILARDPDVVLAPDAAFVQAGRITSEMDETRFLEIAPDLVVEIVPPLTCRETYKPRYGRIWLVECGWSGSFNHGNRT